MVKVIEREKIPGNSIGPVNDGIGDARVSPHLVDKFDVRVTHTRINDRNNHVGGTGGNVPRASRVNVRTRNAAGKPYVMQPPKASILISRIRRHFAGCAQIVCFDIFKKTGILQSSNPLQQHLSLRNTFKRKGRLALTLTALGGAGTRTAR